MQKFNYNYSYQPTTDVEQIKQKQISPIEINLLRPNCANACGENCLYMFAQIVSNICFWVGIALVVQGETGAQMGGIALIAFSVFASMILICCGKIRGYLENVQDIEDTKTYFDRIRRTNPIIQYYTDAYHYEQDNEGRSSAVVSWSNTAQLNYQNCIDITPDISKVLEKCSLVRFDTKLIWHPGNQITASNWHNLGEFEKNIARKMDQEVSQKDTSTLPGQLGEILVYSRNKPCCITLQMFYFFHLIQMGTLFDLLFYCNTGHFTLKVQKIVIQLESLVLSANNQHFSNFADMLLQKMFNLVDFKNQMPMMMNPTMNQPILQNNFAAQQNLFGQQPQQMPMNYVPEQQQFIQQQGQLGQPFMNQPNLAQQYPLQPQQQFQNPNQNYMNQYLVNQMAPNQMAPNQMATNQINPNQFAPEYTLPQLDKK